MSGIAASWIWRSKCRCAGDATLAPLLFGILMLIIVTVYFTLVEVAKVLFYRSLDTPRAQASGDFVQRLERSLARFRHQPSQETQEPSQGLAP